MLARACAAALAALSFAAAGQQAPASTPAAPQAPRAPQAPDDQEPAAPELPPDPADEPGDVRYRANSVRYDTASRKVFLEGDVVLERGEGRLYAARGTLDRALGFFLLEGGVLAVQGLRVTVADAALVHLKSNATDLTKATMYLKDQSAARGLAGLKSREAARGAGKNTLVLHGTSLQELAGGGFIAREVALTPCDCAGPPDYQVLSPEVVVRGDRAVLRSPSLELFGLPLPVGVPISLPLTERQTGLLAPKFGYQLITGFGIVQPVFVTLGRSWDATIAPGWFTGAVEASPPASPLLLPIAPPQHLLHQDNFRAAVQTRTERGPRLDLQLRGAPIEGTTLQLDANMVKDLDSDRSVALADNAFGVPGSAAGRGLSGLRGSLRVQERSRLFDGWQAALDGTLATDALVLPDSQPTSLERLVDHLRSDAGVWGGAGPLRLGADATLLLDARIPDLANPDRRLYGAEARRTMDRLPAFFAQLPATPLVGPVQLAGEVSAVRYQPLRAIDPEERATGFAPTDANAALAPDQHPTSALGLARASMVRVDAAPRLEATLASGPTGAVSAWAGARADAWAFDGASDRNRQRAYALASARAESELSKPYGALLHTIAPSVEVRALSPALAGGGQPIGDPSDGGGAAWSAQPGFAQQGVSPGNTVRGTPAVKPDGTPVSCPTDGPLYCATTTGVPGARRGYDEIDGAAPERGAVQAVFRIAQAVWAQGAPNGPARRVLELTLQQDALLFVGGGRSRLGEVSAQAAAHLGPFNAGVRAQYDWSLHAFTGLSADGSLGDGRGDSLLASIFLLDGAPSELLRAGIDELFSSVHLARDPGSTAGSARVGAIARLPFERPPVSLSYTLEKALSQPTGFPDTTHHASAQIDTACRCAGVSLALDLPYIQGKAQAPTIRFVLDLKSLGTFGTP